ncbi:hypothetical protein IFM89_010072 [Coptis chinensis]|uniref:Uncharacterized protein n=1 Tax=Coptis chinensis TaxID=261450 RepID=A0A835HJ43_9MAGN|nr:hypothetical protein IFM89_010072 [Coptis chinensis]
MKTDEIADKEVKENLYVSDTCPYYSYTSEATALVLPVVTLPKASNSVRNAFLSLVLCSFQLFLSTVPDIYYCVASLSDFDLNGLINVSGGGNGYGSGSFFNPLNSGFLALNGFGSGYDNMGGFEIGKAVWPLGEVSETAGAGNAISGGGGDGNTWQFGIGSDGGFGETECLTNWTELAMATASRKSVK